MSKGIEQKYFDWVEHDETSIGLQFYKCTVKEPFGPYVKGQILGTVMFDFDESYVAVFNSILYARETGEADWTGRISLTIE